MTPYFIIAIGMVVFSVTYDYKTIWIELTINTVMLASFIGYAQYKDKLINVFFSKK